MQENDEVLGVLVDEFIEEKIKEVTLAQVNDVFISYDLMILDFYNQFKDKIEYHHREYIYKKIMDILTDTNKTPLFIVKDIDGKLVMWDIMNDRRAILKDLYTFIYTKVNDMLTEEIWIYIRSHEELAKLTFRLNITLVSNSFIQFVDSFNGYILTNNSLFPEQEWLISHFIATTPKVADKVIYMTDMREWYTNVMSYELKGILYINSIAGNLKECYLPISYVADIESTNIKSRIFLKSLVAPPNGLNKEIAADIEKSETHPTIALAKLFDLGGASIGGRSI